MSYKRIAVLVVSLQNWSSKSSRLIFFYAICVFTILTVRGGPSALLYGSSNPFGLVSQTQALS